MCKGCTLPWPACHNGPPKKLCFLATNTAKIIDQILIKNAGGLKKYKQRLQKPYLSDIS